MSELFYSPIHTTMAMKRDIITGIPQNIILSKDGDGIKAIAPD
jgi:hypothetical protein